MADLIFETCQQQIILDNVLFYLNIYDLYNLKNTCKFFNKNVNVADKLENIPWRITLYYKDRTIKSLKIWIGWFSEDDTPDNYLVMTTNRMGFGGKILRNLYQGTRINLTIVLKNGQPWIKNPNVPSDKSSYCPEIKVGSLVKTKNKSQANLPINMMISETFRKKNQMVYYTEGLFVVPQTFFNPVKRRRIYH